MALIPFQEYAKDNPYNFSTSKLRYLLKENPDFEKVFRRISSRSVFVDEEAMNLWIANKKFYTVKRNKKAAVK